jgi:hypothetical protein
MMTPPPKILELVQRFQDNLDAGLGVLTGLYLSQKRPENPAE